MNKTVIEYLKEALIKVESLTKEEIDTLIVDKFINYNSKLMDDLQKMEEKEKLTEQSK